METALCYWCGCDTLPFNGNPIANQCFSCCSKYMSQFTEQACWNLSKYTDEQAAVITKHGESDELTAEDWTIYLEVFLEWFRALPQD